jgi:hypothetical protein
MSKLTSYQKLKLENQKLKQDIFNLVRKENELDGITTKAKYSIMYDTHDAIMLLMGTKVSALTYSQINDLNINCYELADFNHDDFSKYYLSGSANVL